MIWTREQAKALTDRALSFSKAEETQVVLTGGDRANVRFARNSVTTAGASSGYSLAIVAKFGQKSGTVTASEFSDASLQRAMRNARFAANACTADRFRSIAASAQPGPPRSPARPDRAGPQRR